jgi:predicted kinase
MLCGKIAAGKSTLSDELGKAEDTVVISEDRWIAQLYPSEIKGLGDYFERSERLRGTVAPHVVNLLRVGVSVVLDFHANTVRARRWMRDLFEKAGAAHQLHFLDVTDEVCLARMHARRAAGEHALSDTEFHHVTSFFVAPAPDEGFNVIRYGDHP